MELTLILYWTNTLSAAVAYLDVTQSPPLLIATRGDQAKLSCVFSRSEAHVKGAVSWYKAEPEDGGAPSQAVPLKGRFSLTFPKTFLSEGDGSLIISNVSQEDAGTYYCKVLVWEKEEEPGNGTQLIVYARPSQPEIYIKAAAIPEEELTLICHTSGFYPGGIHISWHSAHTSLPDPETLEILTSQHGVTHANLPLILPADYRLQHLEVMCVVQHIALIDSLHASYDHKFEDAALQLVQYLNILKIGLIIGLTIGLLITVTKRCKSKTMKT